MTQYGMIIDLRKCVGCGACALACKTENNTSLRRNGQTHNWADFIHETTGIFPNTNFRTIPVLCNHCSNAPCVEACPVEPKAMYKTAEGITMHNDERCIGCRSCQEACPYSKDEVEKDGASGQYSVISYNNEGEPVYPFFANSAPLIKGCTTSGAELAALTGASPPHKTNFQHSEYGNVRRDNIVEKCILCDHRLRNGMMPACVDACPAGARVFGDLEDKWSDAAQLLAAHKGFVLQEEEGTSPNVHYIRDYSAR